MELYQTSHAKEEVKKQKEANGSGLLYYLKQGPITNLKSSPSKVCRHCNLTAFLAGISWGQHKVFFVYPVKYLDSSQKVWW
jgi:hypothetical protein